jgi:hypothetical protein
MVGVDDDFLYVKFEVIGGFIQESMSGAPKDFGVGLKGHYYYYFDTGSVRIALNVDDGTALTSSFVDSGSTKAFIDNNADPLFVPGMSIMDTGEETQTDGFESELSSGILFARDDGLGPMDTRVVEMALDLQSVGLTRSDFNQLSWSYLGVAVSNPSSAQTNLFANDEFPEAIGFGVEYDTIKGPTSLIPEPSTIGLVGITGVLLVARRRQRSKLCD